MIKIWFLMALMSYPHMPAVMYKGYGGFLTLEECEEKRILIENQIANYEIQRGNTVYIETYCVEFEAFVKFKVLQKTLQLHASPFSQHFFFASITIIHKLYIFYTEIIFKFNKKPIIFFS